jgi:hypothetical protein
LSLEKFSSQTPVFALGAAGKKHLLHRVEKIVGIEKKPVLKINHLVNLVTTFLLIFVFNALLISARQKNKESISFNTWANPFYLYSDAESTKIRPQKVATAVSSNTASLQNLTTKLPNQPATAGFEPDGDGFESYSYFLPAAYKTPDESTLAAQKEQITSTVSAAKEVLKSTEWKEIEKNIGDGLTEREKIEAKRQYIKEVERIDWTSLEKSLRLNYNQINWNRINCELNQALTHIKLDSLQGSYEKVLDQIISIESSIKCTENLENIPFPDESLNEIEVRKHQLRQNLKEIKQLRLKKVDL